MIRKFVPAAILAFGTALPAAADQFVVQLDAPYEGVKAKTLEVLHISEVESFSSDGTHYVILEAPSESYIEALFHATGPNAIALSVLEADWTRPGMAQLSLSQRMGFMTSIDCSFCAS